MRPSSVNYLCPLLTQKNKILLGSGFSVLLSTSVFVSNLNTKVFLLTFSSFRGGISLYFLPWMGYYAIKVFF